MAWPAISNRFRTAEATRKAALPPPPPPPPGAEWIGRKAMGKYELVKFLAEGSNGEVYLARSPGAKADQFVVVKRVKEQLLQNSNFRQFFDGEVESMKLFDHPNIVRLLDATLNDPIGPCLVLEYVHGYTLEAIIAKYPRWFPERLAKMVGQLCHALQAAHDGGIMHRDMKPANVMVTDFNTPKESVKNMDFGFAGFTERPHIQMIELTGHGQIFCCGTPAYVSPEMLKGDTVDGRADIYGLGAMLYEMLTGRMPFHFDTVEEILAGHLKQRPESFHRLGIHDVPPAVEGVIQLALAKFPAERHRCPKDFCVHYGQALGLPDLWNETAPANYTVKSPPKSEALMMDATIRVKPGSVEDKFSFFDQFEAALSPKMAALKLRGFVEDVRGQVVDSDPGVIRMRVDLPDGYQDQRPTRSGLFTWLNTMRRGDPIKGHEPIEVAMQMQNISPSRVAVLIAFTPMQEYMPENLPHWKERCENLYNILRSYLMALN